MDPMRALLKGFRKAWPADLPPVEPAHLSITDPDHGDIFYRGPLLKPPFHRGLGLEWYFGGPNEERGATAARSLAALLRDHARAVRTMSDTAERVDQETRAAGCRMLRYVPTKYYGAHGSTMTLDFDIEFIDDALTRTVKRFAIDSHHRSDKWNALRREMRAQPDRRERSGRGFEVDSVLGWHLAAMTETQLVRLADLLAENPTPEGQDKGKAFLPEWDRTRLERYGIPLPAEVSSLRVASGRILGKVRLGPTLTYNKGRLTTTVRIPATIVAALPGRPIAALAEHPSLPDVPIRRSAVHENGLRAAWIDAESIMVPFPSGLGDLR